MPAFVSPENLETIESLVRDLDNAITNLRAALQGLKEPASETASPEIFVEKLLAMDEQISRTRLLLPLCTTSVQVNENGRSLPLSDLIMEIRSEFDSLARAQLEILLESAPE